VGFFNPLLPKDKKERVGLEAERIKYWLGQGAQPTTRVARILGENELMPMPANGNNPKKQFQKKKEKKKVKKLQQQLLKLLKKQHQQQKLKKKKLLKKQHQQQKLLKKKLQQAKEAAPAAEAPKEEAPKAEAPAPAAEAPKEEAPKAEQLLKQKLQQQKLLKRNKNNLKIIYVASSSVYTLSRSFSWPLSKGLYGKALSKKLWNLKVVNIRDAAEDKHKTVDDTPYGGGSGMF